MVDSILPIPHASAKRLAAISLVVQRISGASLRGGNSLSHLRNKNRRAAHPTLMDP
jgi:hypothetical protein